MLLLLFNVAAHVSDVGTVIGKCTIPTITPWVLWILLVEFSINLSSTVADLSLKGSQEDRNIL
jgi:hypothetical protein